MRRSCFFLLLLMVITGIFHGCAELPLDAQILNGNASEMIDKTFYDQNYTYGAYYNDYDDGKTKLDDVSYPKERAFLITNQQEYDRVFASDADLNVDFSSEMLAVYTFTAEYVREIRIDEVAVDGQKLYIDLSMIKPRQGVGDAVMPYQRYVVIKLDKTNVTEVEINID